MLLVVCCGNSSLCRPISVLGFLIWGLIVFNCGAIKWLYVKGVVTLRKCIY